MGLILRILVNLAAYTASGVFGTFMFALVIINLWNSPTITALVLIASPIATFVHELGHLVVALLFRFRVDQFRVWPLMVRREESGFRLRFGIRPLLPLGLVVARPSTRRNFRSRLGLLVVAGPAANLAVGALLFGAGAILFAAAPVPRVVTLTESVNSLPFQIGSAALLMSSLNLTLGFANLASSQSATHFSDGAMLLDCLLNHPRFRRNQAILQLSAELLSGRRPRDWDPATVDDLLSCSDGSVVDISARLHGYYHALDIGQTDRATALLREALTEWQRYPVPNQAWLVLEGSYVAGYLDRDIEAARLWLLRAGEGTAEKQTRLRAEAALAFAEGRYGDAVRLAEAGLEAAPHSADPGGKLAEIDWLNAMLVEIRKRVQENNPEISISKSSPTALK